MGFIQPCTKREVNPKWGDTAILILTHHLEIVDLECGGMTPLLPDATRRVGEHMDSSFSPFRVKQVNWNLDIRATCRPGGKARSCSRTPNLDEMLREKSQGALPCQFGVGLVVAAR